MTDAQQRESIPVNIQVERQAGEYAARSVGLPQPAVAAWWRWRAERSGEVARRPGHPAKRRAGGEH